MPDEIERTNDIQTDNKPRSDRIDSIVWGLFFIWIGVAVILDLGWSTGLIGAGIILLGEQLVRSLIGVKTQSFWIIAGILLIASGIWTIYEVSISLFPIALIIIGLVILISSFKKRNR
jgi:hypothetical protein